MQEKDAAREMSAAADAAEANAAAAVRRARAAEAAANEVRLNPKP